MERQKLQAELTKALARLQAANAIALDPVSDPDLLASAIDNALAPLNTASMLAGAMVEPGVTIYAVQFTAKFEARIPVRDDEAIQDAIFDIEVPQTAACRYISSTFEALSYQNLATDERVDLQAGDDNGGFLT